MKDLSKLVFGLVLAALLAPSSSAYAQLQKVEQTVFGMDCAPCAYGLEKQMTGFEGVESASVSLNDGRATLQFAEENDLRLEKLRTAIQESGFSAQKATVHVAGTVQQRGRRWTLTTPAGERYVLKGDALDAKPGGRATVTGTVPKGKAPSEDGWALQVKTLRSSA
jgi:copper chaperone CopZ